MKKLTNVQKILKILQSGPKTQADLVRETKIKNVYQIVADLVKKGLVSKVNGIVILNRPRLRPTVDETAKVAVKDEKPSLVQMLEDEITSITDGIRSLMVARSYLLRRIEEEKRDA